MAFSMLRVLTVPLCRPQTATLPLHSFAARSVITRSMKTSVTSSKGGEHAQSDKLDQKNLTQQKGDAKPRYSGDTPDQDVSLLFQPHKLGPFQLSNRIVYAPLTRCRAIDSNPQDNMIEYYQQRARGSEGGLILAEGTVISDTGYGYAHVPGIYTPEHIKRWKDITAAVKKEGATFFCQIWHVGRSSHTDFQPNGKAPLSSVAVPAEGDVFTPSGPKPHSTPQALDKAGIAKLVDEFRQAARNAVDAGFNGVEIHGANGYIIDQFIKPQPNNRTDEYGGSVENRCRLALEIVKAVSDEIGSDKVGIRLSPYGEFGSVKDDKPNATNRYLTEQLNQFNLAYLHMVEPRIAGNEDVEVEDSTFDLNHFRKLFKGTFIAAGGFNRDHAVETLKKGDADLICFGRHYLSNPDLPRRLREGAELNKYNRDTFYSQGNEGYTDYPFLDDGISK